MKKLACILLFAIPLVANAQKPPVKFGDVSMEEIKMVRYDKDTSAAAVVLFDYGESTLNYVQSTGFVLNFERIRRIKVLTKDGYEWGNFEIPLYKEDSEEEKLGALKAVTYNLEKGKIVETKVKSDAIFREETDKNHKLVKVAFPNVKEGSIIEISYTVTSPFWFNFQDWDFQSTIPVQWSEYRVRIPEYFTYKKLMQGYLPMSINESNKVPMSIRLTTREGAGFQTRGTVEYEEISYTENQDRWVIKDVPAFHVEPHLTTYRDYISAINFELNSIQMPNQGVKTFNNSWDDLGKNYLENESAGGVIKGSGFLKDYVEKAIAGKNETPEKIGAIYSFVKDNVLWDGEYRKYADENLKKVIENKKGSSAEINLMLVSMLQKADIKAYPVLISTRNHGFIRKDNPIQSQFNYVIAAVELDGKYFLMDATDRSLPMKILPERCLNGEGFLIKAERAEWIKIDALKSRNTINADVSLSADGDLKGKIQLSYDGYYAQDVRKKFFKSGKDEYIKEMASSHAWQISTSDFQNMDKLTEIVTEKHELQINDHIQVAGDHMYFTPLVITRVEENPFKLEKREYPVDFGSPEETIYVARIVLPEGWVVEELPQSKIFVLPGNTAKCAFSVSQNGNAINVTSQLVINKALYVMDEYPGLRDFYSRVVAKHAEQIVLKKN